MTEKKLPFEIMDKYIKAYTSIYERIGEITDLDADARKIITDSIIFLMKDEWVQGMDDFRSVSYRFPDRSHLKRFIEELNEGAVVLSDHLVYEDNGDSIEPVDGEMALVKDIGGRKTTYIIDMRVDHRDQPTVVIRSSEPGIEHTRKIYWELTKKGGKRIRVTRRLPDSSMIKEVFSIIGEENIISWESVDFFNSGIAEFSMDEEDMYPLEGDFKAVVEYTSDSGVTQKGEFKILLKKVDFSDDEVIMEITAPSDARRYLRGVLEELKERVNNTTRIAVELDNVPDIDNLKEMIATIGDIVHQDYSLYYDGDGLKPASGRFVVKHEAGHINMDFKARKGSLRLSVTAPRQTEHTAREVIDAIQRWMPDRLYTFPDRPLKISEVRREDIGGLDTVLEALEDIMIYLSNPDTFEMLHIEHPRGALLYGAPGTGKTLIARMIATETEASFIYARGSDLTSFLYGKEQKNIHRLFQMARDNAPTLIFIDEIDGIAPQRDRSDTYMSRGVNQLLTEIDGIEDSKGVVLLAATNRLDAVDRALLRGGRIGKLIEVPLPDAEGRKEIFRIHTARFRLDDDVDFDVLAENSEGLSGGDIKEVCMQASIKKFKKLYSAGGYRDISSDDLEKFTLSMDDILSVLEETKRKKGNGVPSGDTRLYA